MTDGIVQHQNRDDLHGITVVVEGVSGRTYVGRWHERQPRGIVMRDVAILEAGGDVEGWVSRLRKFGIPPEHRVHVVDTAEFLSVRHFKE